MGYGGLASGGLQDGFLSELIGTPLHPSSPGGAAIDIDLETTGQLPRYRTISEGQTLYVAKNGAEYTSIKVAVDSIGDATAAKPYVVLVAPGVYAEDPIAMKPYVAVAGRGDLFSVVVQANSNAAHLITGAPGATLANVALVGPTNAGFAAVYHAAESFVPFICDHVIVRRGCYGFWADSPTARGLMHCFFCGNQYAGAQIDQFMRATRFGNITAMASAFMSGPPDAVKHGYVVIGPDAEMTLDLCAFRNAPAVAGLGLPTALLADGGAFVRLAACTFAQGDRAIHVGSGAGGTRVRAAGCIIRDGQFSEDIRVDAPDAVVSYSNAADRGKIIVVPGASFVASFQDVTDAGGEGHAVIGELWLGTLAESVPLASYSRASISTGHVLGGALSRTGGLGISVAAGIGYINTGTGVVRVEWPTTAILLPASAERRIYVDVSGVVQTSPGDPSNEANIVLGAARTDGIGVASLITHEVDLAQHLPAFHEYAEEVVGSISVSGCAATLSATPLCIDVDSGAFYTAQSRRTVPATAPISFAYWYRDGAGGHALAPGQTIVNPEYYDDETGVLALVPAGKWTKQVLFVAPGSEGPEYSVVYGQEYFDSQAAAESGNTPVAPDYLSKLALRIAGVVTQRGAAVIASLVDLRPRLGQMVSGSTVVTDHGLLSGLGDDDHIAYLLANGARAMTGPLNMGGQSVGNVNLIDGRDVSADGAALSAHLVNTSNPHGVTAAQAGADLAGTAAAGMVAHLAAADPHPLTSPIVESTVIITTTSLTFVVADGMTITPGAGTYLAWFSATGSHNKNGQAIHVSIFANGVQVPESNRRAGGQADNTSGVACMARITVVAGQAIDARWKVTSNAGGGQGTLNERTLVLLKVG